MYSRKLLVLMMTVGAATLGLACGGGEPEESAYDGETLEEAVDTEVAVEPGEGEMTEEPSAGEMEEGNADRPDPGEMTEEEKVAWVEENCICAQCPTYVPCAAQEDELGYCAVGESNCIVEEISCICPECPVTEEMGLEWGYYCTRGSAEEMAAAEGE